MRHTINLLVLITLCVLACGCSSILAQKSDSAPALTSSNTPPVSTPNTSAGQALASSGDANRAAVPNAQAQFAVVHFDLDSSLLSESARSALQTNARSISASPEGKVVIQGHCDERGSTDYNLALGDRRASAIKTYLIDLGVNANQLETVSYGEERPVATGHDEAAWEQNRRGEFAWD